MLVNLQHSPGEWIVLAEDPKVDLEFLVDSFSLAVSLRVISSGEGKGVSKKFSEFLCKEGCKLGTSIRDNLVVESKSGVDPVIKEGGDICSGGSFRSWGEITPFVRPWSTMTVISILFPVTTLV